MSRRIPIGVALSLAIILSGCTQPPTAVVESVPPETPTPTIAPTPTEEPTPTPSPPPTVVPRTPRPRPTTRTAGEQLLPYWFQTRALFTIMPPTPQIDFDEPAGSEFDGWYEGLNGSGQPIFSVREDLVMTPSVALHEIGHAYEDVLKLKFPGTDFRARYWTFRGFPSTWQVALKDANTQPPGMAQWIHLPGESWAEAFSIAMIGGGREKTLDYGRTINPSATKSFFLSLMTSTAP
jgi:hypothetical protein